MCLKDNELISGTKNGKTILIEVLEALNRILDFNWCEYQNSAQIGLSKIYEVIDQLDGI